jgi:hypothetical protein
MENVRFLSVPLICYNSHCRHYFTINNWFRSILGKLDVSKHSYASICSLIKHKIQFIITAHRQRRWNDMPNNWNIFQSFCLFPSWFYAITSVLLRTYPNNFSKFTLRRKLIKHQEFLLKIMLFHLTLQW